MGRIELQRMVESLEWKHHAPRLLKAYADTVGSERQLAASDVALRESEK